MIVFFFIASIVGLTFYGIGLQTKWAVFLFGRSYGQLHLNCGTERMPEDD